MDNVESGDALVEAKKQLKRERNKKYRGTHREKVLASKREYDSRAEIKERKKKYREENKEHLSQWKKDWYQRNKESVLKRVKKRAAETTERRKEYLKEYFGRPEAKKLKRQQGNRYRQINQIQIKARRLAYKALKDGEIQKKTCEECGKEKVEMHHPDYSKPLQVRWLCKRHHMIADGTIPLT